ncbi:MAG: DUF2808 domain-containing protein [Phormidesmis sp. CAN_BIN44]|nr:DUF2808 domain-containing protein [Phormidesmis sp. CAN_BIN44]
MIYRFALSTGVAFLAALGAIAAPLQPSQAVQLSDGTVFFTAPPRLAGASTTNNSVNAWSVTYYFTLNQLENAGEPLQRVTIVQDEGTDTVRFSPKEIEAFEGTRDRLGAKLPLGEVTTDRKTRTVTVSFNPPVPPGRTVTIALSPDRNPLYGGVYLFGVTAFPPGEKTHGQFLGFGRLNFYEGGHSFFR